MSRTNKSSSTGSKAVDSTCQNKTCPTCQMRKKYKDKKKTPIIQNEFGKWRTIKNF